MGYFEQAQLSTDNDFTLRIAASAAVEKDLTDTNATTWATDHQWQIAAAPGFADKYSSALAGGVSNPGRDPAVISDAEILSAVQAEP
jgi:hypothetical protein